MNRSILQFPLYTNGEKFGKLFYYSNRILLKNQNVIFRKIRKTRPISVNSDANILCFSVVNHASTNMFLLAIKSLLRFAEGRFRVLVQSDGTLTEADVTAIHTHLPGIEIWTPQDTKRNILEKLPDDLAYAVEPGKANLFVLYQFLLTFFLASNFEKVIHLDSDVVFPYEPRHILNWSAQGGKGFHFPGGNNLHAAFVALGITGNRVNTNGFNAGVFGLESNNSFDTHCLELLRKIITEAPELMCRWETAQALIALTLDQSSGSVPLNGEFGERVATGWSTQEAVTAATVIHFVGTTRFRNWYYPTIANRICKELGI